MMPLTLAPVGEESMIRRVGGKAEVRAHLENLRICARRLCYSDCGDGWQFDCKCKGIQSGNQQGNG